MEFKDNETAREYLGVPRINRIRLEFKERKADRRLAGRSNVLIESDWNLKEDTELWITEPITVLIESDWNLK